MLRLTKADPEIACFVVLSDKAETTDVMIESVTIIATLHGPDSETCYKRKPVILDLDRLDPDADAMPLLKTGRAGTI
jgi:hypothetical protein